MWGTIINIFVDQENCAKNFSGSREHERKAYLGTRGFINEEQEIKSKKMKGSWEHAPPWEELFIPRWRIDRGTLGTGRYHLGYEKPLIHSWGN